MGSGVLLPTPPVLEETGAYAVGDDILCANPGAFLRQPIAFVWKSYRRRMALAIEISLSAERI
jgi:hypothetical protein